MLADVEMRSRRLYIGNNPMVGMRERPLCSAALGPIEVLRFMCSHSSLIVIISRHFRSRCSKHVLCTREMRSQALIPGSTSTSSHVSASLLLHCKATSIRSLSISLADIVHRQPRILSIVIRNSAPLLMLPPDSKTSGSIRILLSRYLAARTAHFR